MSTPDFKPGDRVRCVDVMGQPSESLKLDDTALYTVASITHHGMLALESNPGPWLPSRFVKVELESTRPEFVVGQKVSGGDYPRLPIGSVVFDEPTAEDTVASVPVLKTGEDEWTNQGWPGVFTNAEMADVRTLTRLGDGIADVEIVESERVFLCCAAPSHIHGTIVTPTGERVEGTLTAETTDTDERIGAWERVAQHPIFAGCYAVEGPLIDAVIARLDELLQIAYVNPGDADADDAYVETEPLTRIAIDTLDREEIHRLIACLPADWGLIEPDGSVLSEVINQVAGALLEFANPKPARCTSLRDMSDSVRIQCAKDTDDLVHMHRTVYAGVEVRWPDDEAYGRVEVSS